ncbi:hypothetical protein D9M69_690540 [compost metagenome]
MKNVERFANARNTTKRCKSCIALTARYQQALDHKGTIDAFKRHHITNRCKCDQIEHTEQIRSCTFSTFTQNFGDLNKRQENNACRTKVLLL